MIEFVGFITEHDLIKESKTFQEYQANPENTQALIDQITSHLDKGVIIFGWMGYTYDLTDQTPIAPHAYYTDGVLIWPSYLKYYLVKYPAFNLDEATVRRIFQRISCPLMIHPEDLFKMESVLSEKLNSAS